MYEEYYSEIVSKIAETRNAINELDYAVDLLKKIQEDVFNITNRNYSTLQHKAK